MIVLGLSGIFLPAEIFVVVLVLNQIGDIVFCTGILGVLELF